MEPVALLTVICFSFLSGCGTILPEKFTSADESFKENELKAFLFKGAMEATNKPGSLLVPPESQRKMVLEVPFEDAWRASMQAIVQAQFDVESSQKSKGYILAKKLKSKTGGGAGGVTMTFRTQYIFAILVKESGPKTTEVQILSKVQANCLKAGAIWYPMLVLGVITIFMIPTVYMDNVRCEEETSIAHWAAGPENDEQVAQVATFVRNNLIAAGAL